MTLQPDTRQRSKRVPPHLPKPVTRFMISRSRFCNRAVGQRPCSRSEEQSGGGGRHARATSSYSRTFLGFRRAIHPRESPVAAGSAAIIRQAQELSRFAASTLSQMVAARNTKTLCCCEEAVEDVSSLWKSEENCELISRDAPFPGFPDKSRVPHFSPLLREVGVLCPEAQYLPAKDATPRFILCHCESARRGRPTRRDNASNLGSDRRLSRGRENSPEPPKQNRSSKSNFLALVLVQTYAAKKILETRIRMQAVQHQVRF